MKTIQNKRPMEGKYFAQVYDLFCNPIKSCGGFWEGTLRINEYGPEYDHEFVVINNKFVFCAQRGKKEIGATGIKSMCYIRTQIIKDREGLTLVINAPGMPEHSIRLDAHREGRQLDVRMWDGWCWGMDQGNEAAAWFTKFLSKEVPGDYRLVRMPPKGNRRAAISGAPLRYADAHSFLITSVASLAHIDSLAGPDETPVPMTNFRPTISLTNCDKFAEDELLGRTFRIGDVTFMGVKPCVRCPIPTIDQNTAKQGKFPNSVLGKHRLELHPYLLEKLGEEALQEAIFGMNADHLSTGTIRVGDPVYLLD